MTACKVIPDGCGAHFCEAHDKLALYCVEEERDRYKAALEMISQHGFTGPGATSVARDALSGRPKAPRTVHEEYYAIISKGTGEVIGTTVGEDGKQDVLREEPHVTFRRIDKDERERLDSEGL